MTKKELREQLLNDTIAFVMNGGQIEEIPAKKIRTKVIVRGKTSRANTAGGDMPTFRISSLYNREIEE